MIPDKVFQEVRRNRESIAERNDFNVRKIVEDVKRRVADRKKRRQHEGRGAIKTTDSA